MIMSSSIAFEDFLGSSIAPKVMPPWWTLYESERQKSIWKTLHLSWEEAGGSESKHFFTSSFDLTWYCLRSHLIVPENWADPTSSGLISLDLTHSSFSLSIIFDRKSFYVRDTVNVQVSVVVSKGRGDVLQDTGLTWSCPSPGPVCSTEADGTSYFAHFLHSPIDPFMTWLI